MNIKTALSLAAASACLVAPPALWAQSKGSIMVRGGALQIAPVVNSGNLSAPNFGPVEGTKIDIHSKTQLGAGITYMVTDHVSLDVPLSTPFTHTIVGDERIAGVGRIGTVKALPVTLAVQYRFRAPNARVRPFVGAGLAYSYFYDQVMTGTFNGLTGGTSSTPTTVKTRNKLAPLLQVGGTIALKGNWFIEASVAKAWLNTRSDLSSGQRISYRLDPFIYQIGLGYRF